MRAAWSPSPRLAIRATSPACSRIRSKKSKEQGEVEVQLAGRPFRIKREFLDDVARKSSRNASPRLRKALLVFHSPTDDTRRHRQCLAYFHRRQASEELRLARRRRSSAQQERRRGLCGQRDRGLGRPLSRPAGNHDRGGGRDRPRAGARDAWRKIPAGNLDRAAPPARRRAGQARRARIPGPGLTIFCSPGSAPAPR